MSERDSLAVYLEDHELLDALESVGTLMFAVGQCDRGRDQSLRRRSTLIWGLTRHSSGHELRGQGR